MGKALRSKWILIELSISLLALFATVAQVPTQPLQKVFISYSSGGITSIDLFIARERGFFREEGLEPQLGKAQTPAG